MCCMNINRRVDARVIYKDNKNCPELLNFIGNVLFWFAGMWDVGAVLVSGQTPEAKNKCSSCWCGRIELCVIECGGLAITCRRSHLLTGQT